MRNKKQPESLLFVIFQLGIGGAEGQFRNLVNHLLKQDIPISVYSLCQKTLDIDILMEPETPVIFGNRRNPFDPFPIFQLSKHIKLSKPKVIICFDRHSWIYSLIARILSGLDVPIIARSMETRGLITWRAEIQLLLARYLLRPYDRIVALSTILKNQLETRWGFSGEIIQIIPIGVDTRKFSVEAIPEKTEVRKKFNIPEDSLVIVQIANLSTNKNQEFSLELARELIKNKKFDLHLVLVGGGSRQRWNKLHQLARNWGISDRVVFTGVQDDVRPYLAMADFLLLCSKAEATPNVVLEALACEIPVLVSEYDSAQEQLGTKLSQWITPLGKQDQFITKAAELLHKPELRNEIGIIGRRHIVALYSIDVSFQRWRNLIQEMISSKLE